MKNRIVVFAFGLLLFSPFYALAAGGHGGQGDHEVMPGMEHKGHGDEKVAAGLIMLGEQVVDGVKGMAHLKDVKETMAKMGMKETHHFMVLFANAKDGKAITEGTVAVKIKGPDGKEGQAIKLMGMEGHFGADVVLDKKGDYIFTVGTQLSDGVKRQFVIKSEVK